MWLTLEYPTTYLRSDWAKADTAPYKTFQTKSAADKYGLETVSSIDLGTFKRNTEFSDFAKLTLGAALQEYIDLHPTRTEKEISRQDDYKNKLPGDSTHYKVNPFTYKVKEAKFLKVKKPVKLEEGIQEIIDDYFEK